MKRKPRNQLRAAYTVPAASWVAWQCDHAKAHAQLATWGREHRELCELVASHSDQLFAALQRRHAPNLVQPVRRVVALALRAPAHLARPWLDLYRAIHAAFFAIGVCMPTVEALHA